MTKKEYIVFEIVMADSLDNAEDIAETNEQGAEVQLLDEFIEENIDYDALREQILEEEGQNQNE